MTKIEEKVEKLAEDYFRSTVVPLYDKEFPVNQMTTYEQARYRDIVGIFNFVSKAIHALYMESLPEIKPEQLHLWYLQSIAYLDGKDFNPMADRPYEKLTEGQKSIDKFIADKVNAEIKERWGSE